LSDADVLAGVETSSALTHQDGAGMNLGSVEYLDAEALRI
jgi:hypothetical protein